MGPDPFRLLLLSGASSVHTIRWANGFADGGLEVHLVSQHEPVDELRRSVTLHRLPHARGLGYLTNGPKLQRIIADLGPHVVNAHYATGYGLLARWVGSTPLVLNVWGSDVYDFPESGPLHRRLLRDNLRRADLVVSTSHAMAIRTLNVCPDLKAPEVVPFGVDTARFSPGTRVPGPMVIGTVKTFAPKYGLDVLIEAFALLDGGMEAHLRLVGGGPQESALRALVQRKGLADRVTFVPRVAHDRVPEQLRGLDVYVALSRLDSESFGVAVIEASACGIPVVVSDAGGLPEVVRDGITGFVVPRNAPAAAADRISELMASEGMRRRMGQEGRAMVQERYEWSKCLDRMIQLLRRTAHEGTTR